MKKKIAFNLQNRLFFIPGTYSFLSFLFACLIIFLESGYNLEGLLPFYLLTPVSLARTILATLVGALLTMISITFSTILVVLTTYGSQYSQRTVQDFISKKTTQRVLGVFLGGFIYSITVLLFMRGEEGARLVISAPVGVLVSFVCLIYFVRFLYFVSSSIQVNHLIDTLTENILNLVKKMQNYQNASDNIRSEPPEDLKSIVSGESIRINSRDTGYIQFIDDLGLTKYADNNGMVVRVEKMIGDYVTEDTRLVSVWNEKKPDFDSLLGFIVVGKERNTRQDVEFGLLKLTEVALKALSPGINDPNTAIYCIKQLGMILSKIGKANIENTYYFNNANELRLIFEDISFGELLYRVFFQIRHYGSSDVSVAMAIIQALVLISEGNDEKIKEKIWEFASYVLDTFNKESLAPLDRKYLNRELARLAVVSGHSGSELYIK